MGTKYPNPRGKIQFNNTFGHRTCGGCRKALEGVSTISMRVKLQETLPTGEILFGEWYVDFISMSEDNKLTWMPDNPRCAFGWTDSNFQFGFYCNAGQWKFGWTNNDSTGPWYVLKCFGVGFVGAAEGEINVVGDGIGTDQDGTDEAELQVFCYMTCITDPP